MLERDLLASSAVLEALGLSQGGALPEARAGPRLVTFATAVREERSRCAGSSRDVSRSAQSRLLAGDPKLGKSTLRLHYAAGVTLGKFGDEPATVLIISAEDCSRA